MNRTRSAFLTAEWRDLAMLNFEIDPKILRPLVPAGTSSMVGGAERWCASSAFGLSIRA
jgi:uncharacterized protein DUF2071